MKLRTILMSAALAAGATIGLASQATAASLVICDAPVCGTPDPNMTFSVNDFEGNFQINSAVVQQGLGNPTSTTVSEVDGSGNSVETDFSGTWILGGPITAQNETVFFTEAGGGISDVLHFTYSSDANGFGHLDGSVISDTETPLTVAALNGRGLFATQTVAETSRPFTFNNTNITASFQSDVPEPSVWAMMLLGFGGLGATLRRQRRHNALTVA